MTVKWQYSPPNNWSVESYKVCWKKAGTIAGTCSGGIGSVTINSAATTGSHSITGLPDDDDKYKFKVKANIVKNSNSNKKKTKTVGTVKEFTDPTPPPAGTPSGSSSNCPTFGAVGQLYAEPTGETTMTLTWAFSPDCSDWTSPINSMTICWERKGSITGICDSNEDTISNPTFSAGYGVAWLKPCKRYRFKLWGNYQNGSREIGTITMRTQCPPKMMMTDNSDCAEEGVSLCIPALNQDTTTFPQLQKELTEPIYGNITSVLKVPSANYEGLLYHLIEGEVIKAVDRSSVYKNLKVGLLADPKDKRLRKLPKGKKADAQDPLTEEEITKVARASYFLREAVDFITNDLALAIEEELYEDLAYAVDRKIECGVDDPCGFLKTAPDPECIKLVPEITKGEVTGDIADAVEDLYDRFDTSDCKPEYTEATLEDILLVRMVEGEVSEHGCPTAGVISNRASSLVAAGTASNLFHHG
jgi:hypothetical protein